MARSSRSSICAAACALLSSGAAWAQSTGRPPPAPDPRPTSARTSEEPSAVDMVRIDAGGSYVRGSRLVGYGTRAPYHGLEGAMRLDVMRFPTPRLGFEIDVLWGGTLRTEGSVHGGLEGAVDVAPLVWTGEWGGSFVLGLGGGVEGGDHPSLDEDVRGYPFALARLRLWPARALSLHASWRFAPVTSNTLATRLQRFELAAGVDFVQMGARVELEEMTGGDPRRTYREIQGGLFVGLAFY